MCFTLDHGFPAIVTFPYLELPPDFFLHSTRMDSWIKWEIGPKIFNIS